ncbi:MAG: glycosyltransferase [Isosphaeraceae bacterium]|nr:glycosyltransferase [Isosphaeraceae bacterium]
MVALYLCYQSLFEPLTQTQVVAYLEGLALDGHRILLLTFEHRPPNVEEVRVWKETLRAKGIDWFWLRYHKRPTAPATAWDILAGVVTGLRLVLWYRVDLVHARVHVPGLMALALKRLTGVKLLFDIRGLMAEEYVDAGLWPAGGVLFRAVKRAERSILRAADGVVILTNQARDLISEWYPLELAAKPVSTIPCCVDLRRFAPAERIPAPTMRALRLVYVGKAGGCYLTEEMLDFAAVARRMVPNVQVNIWTQSDPEDLRPLIEARGLEGCVHVGRVAPEQVPAALADADAALSFMRPCVSNAARSPTKIAEYLSAGLPVVSTVGIGDVDQLLRGDDGTGSQPIGVLIADHSEGAYGQAVTSLLDLLEDPDTPVRCRRAAIEGFDLENVGWARYRQVYKDLDEAHAPEHAVVVTGAPPLP